MRDIARRSGESSIRLWWFVIVVNFGGLIYPILSHRGLFADAAAQFLELISFGSVHDDPLRKGAIYIRDGMTLILVSGLGLRSVKVASWVFNGCLFLMPWLIMLVGERFLPTGRRVLAYFAMCCLILSYFISSVFTVSEVFVASAMWWLVLFYIIGDDLKNRSWLGTTGCFIIALLMIYSYEPLAMGALVLAAIMCLKFPRSNWREEVKNPRTVLPFVFIGGALLAAFLVGARWTLFPADLHRGNALDKWSFLLILLKTYPVRLCIGVLLVGALTLMLSLASASCRGILLGWGIWVVFAVVSLIIGIRVQTSFLMQLNGFWQFEGRLLVPVLVIAFSGAAVLASWRLDRDPSFAVTLTGWFAPMLICLSLLHAWWQVENTRGWRRYLSAVAAEQVPGQVSFPSKQLQSNAFYWPWALGSLSIVTAAISHDRVDSIVYDGAAPQPFDYKCPKSWPSLERFGVRYQLDDANCP